MAMSELPSGPWKELSLDFAGPFSDGIYLMALMDDYSRFPVVYRLSQLTSHEVITALDEILCVFGIPEVIRTDNGPPFKSTAFDQYSKHMGFKHRKITPGYPQANAEIERFMGTMNKTIRTATVEGRNYW